MIDKNWLPIRTVSLAQACRLGCGIPVEANALSALEAARVADMRGLLLEALGRGFARASELSFERDYCYEGYETPGGEDNPVGTPLSIDLRELDEPRHNLLVSNELLRLIGVHNERFIGQPTKSQYQAVVDWPGDSATTDAESSDVVDFETILLYEPLSESPLSDYTELDNDETASTVHVSGAALDAWIYRRAALASAASSPNHPSSDAYATVALSAFGEQYGLRRFQLLAEAINYFVLRADPLHPELFPRGDNIKDALEARFDGAYKPADWEAVGSLFVHALGGRGRPKLKPKPRAAASTQITSVATRAAKE